MSAVGRKLTLNFNKLRKKLTDASHGDQQVCSFLISRVVPPAVVERFRLQKIDGRAVTLLSDDHLSTLGLTAIGDQVTLRAMCQGNLKSDSSIPQSVEPEKTSPDRRKTLLRALRQRESMRGHGSRNGSENKTRSVVHGGRPRQAQRSFTFGLRLLLEKENAVGDRISSQVKSPLGDKNTISIQMPMSEDYSHCLTIVKGAFFPKGNNPVIGSEDDYLLEIVNCRNQNVRENVEPPFTFGKYIDVKKIPGTPKCYLLCSDFTLPDEISETNSIDLTSWNETIPQTLMADDDSLPDLPPPEEEGHTSTCNIPGTPSGEVILTIRQPSNTTREEEKIQWGTIHSCVEGTMKAKANCGDPIEVLKFYQSIVHQGRALEADGTGTIILEGETNAIFVSRFRIFETSMEEIIGLTNHRLTLDVTFYGEMAQDLGGPRREFLGLLMKEALKEERGIFSKCGQGYMLGESSSNLRKKYYYGTGLLAGISLLQQGPVLSFLDENQLQKLLHGQDLSESEKQFRDGLNILGFVDPTSQKEMSFRQLLHLLQPQFSEMGSNKRQMEERTYSHFVGYLREVSAGRRNGVTLGLVLMFVTGAEIEPPLGFENHPTIVFSDVSCCIPRAHTCICQLTLPIGPNVPTAQNQIFDIFDTAFVNSYFGVM